MKPIEKLSIHLAQLESLERPVESVRTAIMAVTAYEQLAERYPTQTEVYRLKIEEIVEYFLKLNNN